VVLVPRLFWRSVNWLPLWVCCIQWSDWCKCSRSRLGLHVERRSNRFSFAPGKTDVTACGLVVRVSGYRSRGLDSIPRVTRFFRSSGSGTGSTQPREYNWGATWKK
jgi:hypothetical protein